ncbi:growth hormone-inducible transmembrane protein-like [Microplitis mediator]|uniref:growth hormone-inducible transmembrane protein-like n=1 Tax=Microplitis mediator TaxID=375433 RepID=UPI0025526721|nr:growth hormone-inducible transmembrane protein-like [Microplitis mediator]XP_057329071.1 growth hormone-inducible transmembrane protein-like [Microplitis mediator]
MLLAKVCRSTVPPQIKSFLKAPVVPKVIRVQAGRLFASDGKTVFQRTARKRATIVEDAVAPAGQTAFNIGKGFAAGSAVLGLGALCYYGAGLSSEIGAIDRATLWPQYVKDRIHTTYMYFGGSILASTASAALCLRSPAFMRMMTQGGLLAFGATLVAMIGTALAAYRIPYQEGFGAKQVAWLLHSGVIGAVLAPLSLLGGPILIRAACYTAGIVGGLSAVAVCAPSEKFLNMGGPLAIGLGVVFASSIGSMFLPPTTVVGSGLHAMCLYGGLVLFSAFLLYDTQTIIKKAETYPVSYDQYGSQSSVIPYDPINNSINIYLDTVNIFVRMVSILSGGGGKRK